MERIRIAHIVQCAGGVDVYLRMLFAHMDRDRFEQILICSTDYSYDRYRPLVDYFEQIPMYNALSLKRDVAAVFSVRRLIRSYRPNIVYCHSSKGGGIGRLACLGLSVPVLYNPHGWAFSMKGAKWKSRLYLILEKLLAPHTDKYVVISYYEKMVALQKRVCSAETIQVIYNGIELCEEVRRPHVASLSRESLGIPQHAYVIGMAGRLSAQKAPDVFVRMASRIRRILPNAYFMIVGDGEDRKIIEQQIETSGLKDCFLITGWQSSPLPYMALVDQAVLLSRWEGFGLVLAEFMQLGKPIVATNVNAIPELVIDYENGILVPCDDDEQAANAVLTIYNDPSLKDKFIRNGFRRCKALFDIRRVAEEHERLFVKLVEHSDGQ